MRLPNSAPNRRPRCHDADHDRRVQDLDAEEREGPAVGEGVDAGRDGEHDERGATTSPVSADKSAERRP